jgi:hypothetical protein
LVERVLKPKTHVFWTLLFAAATYLPLSWHSNYSPTIYSEVMVMVTVTVIVNV